MKLPYVAVLLLFAVAGCAPMATTPSIGGWAMMVPPMTPGGAADTAQPLYNWRNVGRFGSQEDCKNSLANQQFAVHGQYGPIAYAQTPYQAQAVQTLNAQCVAADDPRLFK